MKKILIFALTLMCNVMAFAQVAEDWRISPDEAEYKIYGKFETTFPDDEKVFFELTEVNPVGLKFPVLPKYYGRKTTQGNVYFTFDKVTYSGHPDLDHIALWVYDESLNMWMPDEETGKENANATNTNEMTVVLVLDCSSSLSESGFMDVKNSAKSFIDVMLKSSSAGNIHIGIIGFSAIQQIQTLDIQPLNQSSASRMIGFIDSFRQGNGTALYKSFDDAFDMTSQYAQRLDKFAGSAIVTFTDGLDNGSFNSKKKIGNKDAYYQHIKNEVLQKSIKGIPFLSYTIFVPGGADVKNRDIENKIVDQLKTMAKRDDHYFRVENTSLLDWQFKQIAKSLIDSWKVLSCFISAGQNGQVCWTFGMKKSKPAPAPEPAPAPAPRNGRNIFVGINGTVGFPVSYSSYYSYVNSYYGYSSYSRTSFGMGTNIKFGVDFAWPVADKFAIGAYTNIGGGIGFVDGSFAGAFDMKFGVLMLAGDVNERPFIIGLSPCVGFGMLGDALYVPLELRFGRIIKDHLYITGNLNMGIPITSGFTIEPGITIGYHFGDKWQRR